MADERDENINTIVLSKQTQKSTRINVMHLDEKGEIVKTNNEKLVDITKYTQKYLRVRSQLGREFLAEILSTFILIAFGCGSVAQYKFVLEVNKGKPGDNPLLSVNISWGFGVTLGILVGGKVSGAHMNPAVSLAMLLLGKMRAVRFLVYIVGQFIGAFLGAAFVFIVYYQAFLVAGKTADTAGIFATYPNGNFELGLLGGFVDQVFATSLLIIVVLAVTDSKNVEIPHGTVSILLGLTVLIIGTSFGYNCGYAINPMRDFGPRVFTAIAGWNSQPFTEGNYFFWIPIVGPLSGSIIGTLVYTIFIQNNWP